MTRSDPMTPVPISRLIRDFKLTTPEDVAEFFARNGLPAGREVQDDGTVTVPRARYTLFALGAEARGEVRDTGPDARDNAA